MLLPNCHSLAIRRIIPKAIPLESRVTLSVHLFSPSASRLRRVCAQISRASGTSASALALNSSRLALMAIPSPPGHHLVTRHPQEQIVSIDDWGNLGRHSFRLSFARLSDRPLSASSELAARRFKAATSSAVFARVLYCKEKDKLSKLEQPRGSPQR